MVTFALEYSVRKVKEKSGLELWGPHHFAVYTHVNLLGKNKNTVKKNANLLGATKGVVLEVNKENIMFGSSL